MLNPLEIASVHNKLLRLESAINLAMTKPDSLTIPDEIARDVEVLPIRNMPPKPGLSKPRGQARLMHDLASIELQAMELGFRTLVEFPEAPKEFRQELAEIVSDEGRHLAMCLRALDHLGYRFGSFPVHTMLWQAVAADDSLIDRVLIVHRYLEGAGLDAGESIMNRLSGVDSRFIKEVVSVISSEEIAHVRFGSRWFVRLCSNEGLDAETEFRIRLKKFFHRIPRRMEKLALVARGKAGFVNSELEFLEELQALWKGAEKVHTPQHK